jgi:transposase
MEKAFPAKVQVFAGIDVSARELRVAVHCGVEAGLAVTTFSNKAAGHNALLLYLLRGNARARVCLEASGNYSLDLALTLQAHPQVEISVVNPRRARRFAESLGERSKTDPVDARVLYEYAMRMRWVPWVPPHLAALRLRAITRAIEDLVAMQTQEKNRQHSLLASRALPALVMRELEQHLRYLKLRITRLRREALRLIARHPELNRRFHLMLTTPGLGETSSLQILGELAVLPETWTRASGSLLADWIRRSLVPAPPSKRSRGSAAVVVVTCGELSTCRRWWLFAVSPSCGASTSVYFAAERPRCRLWWQS